MTQFTLYINPKATILQPQFPEIVGFVQYYLLYTYRWIRVARKYPLVFNGANHVANIICSLFIVSFSPKSIASSKYTKVNARYLLRSSHFQYIWFPTDVFVGLFFDIWKQLRCTRTSYTTSVPTCNVFNYSYYKRRRTNTTNRCPLMFDFNKTVRVWQSGIK